MHLRAIDFLRASIVAAYLSGCASASLHVMASAKIAAPIDHVFVVVGEGPFHRSYADEVAAAVLAALRGHTLTCQSRVLTGLELDDAPLNEQLRAFGADGLLMLEPIGGRVHPVNGTVSAIVYKATLLDIRSDRVVWAAEVSHERGLFAAQLGQLVAERVVGSLLQEEIVRSGQPQKGGS